MVRTPREDLERELQNREQAKLYGAADAKAEFAVTLARARGQLGIAQKELADRMGLSQPYIAKLEGGEANPTLGTIGSLLAALGLRVMMRTRPLLLEPGPSATAALDVSPVRAPAQPRSSSVMDIGAIPEPAATSSPLESAYLWGSSA